MRITSIPQSLRNVKRATEIISVLSRYGLADWLAQLNLDMFKGLITNSQGAALARQTRETRIRLALADLGPTFIKLGQILSTRPDLVGVKLANELKSLQADVPADPPEVVRETILEELGEPVDDIFLQFDDAPIASASIGQVHRARLQTGEPIVVKVQHRGIDSKVREDMEILLGLAQLAERLPEFARYRPVTVVAEFQRALRRELDFGREERNLLQFNLEYAEDPTVHIPTPYSDLCTPRVLTMEYVEGIKVWDTERLRGAGYDLDELARRGATLYLRMIFSHGHYHADPHPGNVIILPGNVIGLLDFGLVGRIEERLREDIEEMLLAIVHQDASHLTALICRVGEVPAEMDETALSNEVADFVGHFGTQSLDRFDMAGALNEMLEIIRRYDIALPSQVGLLLKVLVTLDGTSRLLSPKFNIIESLRPLQSEMLRRRLSPVRQWKRMQRLYGELQHLGEVLPRRILDILRQIQTGKFDVHLDHRRLGPSVNRLVLGMLASALFLGSSLLLSRQVPPVLFQEPTWFGMHKVSIIGLGGYVISLLLGLRLLLAIGKSGHLDRPE